MPLSPGTTLGPYEIQSGGRFPQADSEATFWVGDTSFIASRQYVKKYALEYLRALNAQSENRLTIAEQDIA